MSRWSFALVFELSLHFRHELVRARPAERKRTKNSITKGKDLVLCLRRKASFDDRGTSLSRFAASLSAEPRFVPLRFGAAYNSLRLALGDDLVRVDDLAGADLAQVVDGERRLQAQHELLHHVVCVTQVGSHLEAKGTPLQWHSVMFGEKGNTYTKVHGAAKGLPQPRRGKANLESTSCVSGSWTWKLIFSACHSSLASAVRACALSPPFTSVASRLVVLNAISTPDDAISFRF